jgi:hypothetical protein
MVRSKPQRLWVFWACWVGLAHVAMAACPTSSMGAASGAGVNQGLSVGQLAMADRPAALALALGLPSRFALGVGSVDANVVQAQNIKADVYDQYLAGLDWPSWNSPPGAYVGVVAANADCLGAVPMFTLYQMAAWGDGNTAVVTNAAFMTQYWSNARLLFQQLAAYGKPAMVNIEPDFWGYTQHQNPEPSQMPALVSATSGGECSNQPDTLAGVAACMIQLARKYAPKAKVGFAASVFQDLAATEPAYLKKLGAGNADFVSIATLDRDFGCMEMQYAPSGCTRSTGAAENWDETNTTSPNFAQHLAQVSLYFQTLGVPVVWWQTPLGVVSATPGGTPGHFRDNRVDYFTKNANQLAAVGGLAAVFSPGDSAQTSLMTDGGNYARLASAYQARPVQLAQSCAYSLGLSNATLSSSAGTGSWAIGLPSWCSANASSASPWISLFGSASGNGSLSYSVTANASASTRIGTVTVAGQTFTITQSAAHAQAAQGGGQITGVPGVVNVAVFSGALAQYAVVVNATSGLVSVADSVAARDGTSTLANMQRAQFSDQNMAFDISSPASAGGIYRIYAAAFNRTPDPAGLGYWIYQSDAGQSAVQIATGFTYSKEFQTLYGATITDNYATGANLTLLVTGFYSNVLHRTPDAGGLAFYVNALQTRSKTLGQVLAEIADSPENRAQVASQIQNGIAFLPWHG